jgi:hypothetical protein
MVFYPGLWPIFPRSAPNLARRQGRISVIDVGPMKHMGIGDYMSRSAVLPDGRRYVDKTVDVLVGFVREIEGRALSGAQPPLPASTERRQSGAVGP